MAREMVQVSFTAPRELEDRMRAGCTGSASAYLRALIEGDLWRLERALARLRSAGVDEDELVELAREPAPGQISLVEAAGVVLEARQRGLRAALDLGTLDMEESHEDRRS